jgi:acetyltransferase-like isoleucine patch superfamily enzyme
MNYSAGRGSAGELDDLYRRFRHMLLLKRDEIRKSHKRTLPMADYFVDRWEKAQSLGFGDGSSVYDSCLILGDVMVGENTWIGPFTILDGTGGLRIGNNCSISAGVHIYTHDSLGRIYEQDADAPVATSPVSIGDSCYIGPNSVISRGVTLGDRCVIGANSFVNRSVPPMKKAYGNPAQIQES